MEVCKLLKPLTELLIEEVKLYGILEVSIEQYEVACKSIIRFANSSGEFKYTPGLMSSYKEWLDTRVASGEICTEYRRFQNRVVRMLTSLAETGNVDFSSVEHPIFRYPVDGETTILVEKILDSNHLSDSTKRDLRAPMRHIFWYATEQGIAPQNIDDSTIMRYLIEEVPKTNGGSTGRTLRCVKYTTEFLKKNGNSKILRDYTLLKLKNNHRRIIPAYSEEEILNIIESTDTDSALPTLPDERQNC